MADDPTTTGVNWDTYEPTPDTTYGSDDSAAVGGTDEAFVDDDEPAFDPVPDTYQDDPGGGGGGAPRSEPAPAPAPDPDPVDVRGPTASDRASVIGGPTVDKAATQLDAQTPGVDIDPQNVELERSGDTVRARPTGAAAEEIQDLRQEGLERQTRDLPEERAFGGFARTRDEPTTEPAPNVARVPREEDAESDVRREVQTAFPDAILGEDDVTVDRRPTSDGTLLDAELTPEGRETIAAERAPLGDVPGIGDLTRGGAVARVRYNRFRRETTQPAFEAGIDRTTSAVDDVTPEGAGLGDVQLVGGATNPNPFEGPGPEARDVDRESAATASAVGVAAPEPISTTGGLIVGGALAAGAAGQQLATAPDAPFATSAEIEVPQDQQQGELPASGGGFASELDPTETQTVELEPTDTGATTELEPGEPTTSEVSLPGGDAGAATGQPRDDTVVPAEFPLAGRDFPADPTRDRAQRTTRPGRIFETAPAGGLVRERQREEAESPTIGGDDIITDIGQPGQAPPSTRERQRRDDLDPFERSFPTGAGAVVGRDAATEPSVGLGESVGEVSQPAQTATVGAGVGLTPFTGVGVGQPSLTATASSLLPMLDQQPRLANETVQVNAAVEAQEPAFESPTLPLFQQQVATGVGAGGGPGGGQSGPQFPLFDAGGDPEEPDDPEEPRPATVGFTNPIATLFDGPGFGPFG